jgi:hypothetical protein
MQDAAMPAQVVGRRSATVLFDVRWRRDRDEAHIAPEWHCDHVLQNGLDQAHAGEMPQ